MKQAYPLLLLLFIFCFSSCSPLRVVRLSPENEEEVSRYLYGNAILERSTESTDVTLSYYDASRDYLVFNLEVRNTGTEAYDFDPAACYLISDIGTTTQAVDPEMQLLSMDVEAIRDIRRDRTIAWVGAGLLVAAAVTAAVEPSSGVGEALVGNNNQLAAGLAFDVVDFAVWTAASDNTRLSEAYLPPNDVPTPENRFFWLDYAARVTTIRPGESMVGKIAFRREDEAGAYSFNLPLPEGTLAFDFRQRVIRP